MNRFGLLLSGVVFLSASAAFAQASSDDLLKQLAPAETNAAAKALSDPVLSIQTATKDEFLSRLSSSATRNLGPAATRGLPPFAKGREGEVMNAVRDFPSAQVAVTFQGATDALSPEAGAMLETLSQALLDPRVASSRFLIGVHTNSVGSDEYNLDLSDLRAKAIVDTLAAVHGVSRSRLVAFGFGRIGASQDPTDERIQVVNLGANAFELAPAQAAAPTPPPAPVVTHRPTHSARPVLEHPRFHPKPAPAWAYAPPRPPRPPRHVLRPDWELRPPTVSVAQPEPVRSVPVAPPVQDQFMQHGGSGGGGGGGGGGWSDRRLKRRIRRIGTAANGLTLYSFQYVWGGPLFVGVMAQEVMSVYPEAVLEGPGGYLRVDYEKLGMRMMTLDDWLKVSADVF